MNKIDRERYKALKFLSENTRAKLKSNDEDGISEYPKYVPKDVEDYLKLKSFVDLNGNSKYIITEDGLEELRKLETKWYQYLSLMISIASLIISLIALSKSFKLFGFT